MLTIFDEVSVEELFKHDHVYYTKISRDRGLRRSPGGDQPDMRQETIFHPMASVITRQHPAQIPHDLLPYEAAQKEQV